MAGWPVWKGRNSAQRHCHCVTLGECRQDGKKSQDQGFPGKKDAITKPVGLLTEKGGCPPPN